MIESIEIIIWGREFNLPIEYNCYQDEKVTKEQIEALKCFIAHPQWIDEAKHHLEEYCKDDVMGDVENTKKDNIFSYIKPECLFVKRDKENHRIAMMCKYRYDLEHGLAVVFSLDGKITVGIQDIIL